MIVKLAVPLHFSGVSYGLICSQILKDCGLKLTHDYSWHYSGQSKEIHFSINDEHTQMASVLLLKAPQ